MAKQTFTTGQVLTAAQMTSLQQTAMGGGSATAKTASYTLVAADAGATVIMNSASSTTITVNTALFSAGDTVLIVNQGAGVCTVTAGTATVSTAGSLALSQYETGILYFLSTSAAIFSDYTQAAGSASGLTLVTSQTIGSAVSSVTVTGAFSSTYDNYKIVISGGVGSTAGDQLRLQLGSTTTGYYRFAIYGTYSAATVTGENNSNGAYWQGVGTTNTSNTTANFELLSPNLAKNTVLQATYSVAATAGNAFWLNGYLNDSTQYTAFTITPSAGTLTGGTIRVYGYQNS